MIASILGNMPLELRAGSGLAPFDPPYEIGGRCAIIVGLWAEEPSLPAITVSSEYRCLRWFGRPLGVLIASDFTEPPEELPIAYREVIAAVVARHGRRVVFLPFDMVLDAMPPVELGHLHYSLPKRYDEALFVDLDSKAPSVSGSDVTIRLRDRTWFAWFVTAPLRFAFAAGVWLLTRVIDVVGAAEDPARRARIALGPRSVGKPCRPEEIAVGGIRFFTLWAQRWRSVQTVLGVPERERMKTEA